MFQCRPTLGNESYALPLEHAYALFAEAQNCGSGLTKRARFVMSHTTGKIEVVGLSGGHIYMRYHQAANPADANRMLVFRSNRAARWLDDYEEMAALTNNSQAESESLSK
jgi:lysine 2,3-aminomutase